MLLVMIFIFRKTSLHHQLTNNYVSINLSNAVEQENNRDYG